jgi:hypothetical protein
MRIRTLLLFALLGLVISQVIRPPQSRHIDLCDWDSTLFTPTICNLHIPDIVNTRHSEWANSVEGSGLSMLMPDGYIQSVDFRGFYRDKDTSINISEDHVVGFPAFKEDIKHRLADLNKCNSPEVKLLYKKDFKFNDYDATALYLYDEHRRQTYVYMAFGNDGFHVTMKGACKGDDLDARDQIVSAFLSSYYEKAKA